MPDYEKLDVWRKAHALAVEVHRAAPADATAARLPRERLAGAALTVASTIARGAEADTPAQFAEALGRAADALCDVHYLLRFARDVSVVTDVAFARLEARVLQLRAMLASLERVVIQRAVASRGRAGARASPSRAAAARSTTTGPRDRSATPLAVASPKSVRPSAGPRLPRGAPENGSL